MSDWNNKKEKRPRKDIVAELSRLTALKNDYYDDRKRLTARNEVLEAVIKHIHWSMGDRRIFSDEARDVICDLCDKALAAEDKDDAG